MYCFITVILSNTKREPLLSEVSDFYGSFVWFLSGVCFGGMTVLVVLPKDAWSCRRHETKTPPAGTNNQSWNLS